ncbi:histidine triad nucleotide-binding protein 3-like [Gigantopelta aegis]|uniref:histidine triad nucleotide-binding protein 3-like n=1 Tax=Gigantopelta aegis TaxID=1735272 RepID=UPI001B889243|nr:histidine triad nucleotide-binding protein 3-like [Gigantopelta aegis]
MSESKCIFCKIIAGTATVQNTDFLFESDDFVVFRDIRPASKHHYLVVPKEHMSDSASLKESDVDLVERMVAIGKEVLEKQGADVSDNRMGFHWPPFHTVSHLHLHVISAQNEMGWIARLIFKPNSFWFVTVDWLLNRLRNMNAESAKQ